MLDYYHSLYDEDHKTYLQSKIESFAVAQNFVTEFTSLVVVQSDQPRDRRGAQKATKPIRNPNIQIKKKRSQEKRDQIQALFQQYFPANEYSNDTLVDESEDFIAKEDMARASDEHIISIPMNDFMKQYAIEQKSHTIKTLIYFFLSIVAFKLFTSRRVRSLIRF